MRLFIQLVIMTALVSTTPSCASYFKRKTCEKTNWFEYGKKKAMSGERLTGDQFIQDCEKAEALVQHDQLDLGFKSGMKNYCLPGTAYSKGREGEKFNFNFCSKKVDQLRSEYSRGIKDYCTPDGGYQAGTQGTKYANNCPKDLETAFLKRYRAGRAIFLQGEIRKKERALIDIDDQIRRKEREMRDIRFRISNLPRARVIRKESNRDLNRTSTDIVVSDEETQETALERNRLERRYRNTETAIRSLENQKRAMRLEIVDIRTEINSLRAF